VLLFRSISSSISVYAVRFDIKTCFGNHGNIADNLF
jgi:hypothetical protein